MNRFFVFFAIPAVLTSFVFPALGEEKAAEYKDSMTPDEELSYVLGMDVGNSLKRYGADIDFDIFIDAMRTTLKGGETMLTPERAVKVKRSFLQRKRNELTAERKAAGEKNLAEGEAFLAENKNKEGVTTTDSGLQYQVIKEGTGAKPQATDKVTVHYRGTLLDGSEFDSSHTRGKPATFPVKGVIAGWTEALQLMPAGSTYKLFIPSKLAYGERGGGNKIGPNSTLIFEVELLKVVAAEQEQPDEATQAARPVTKQAQEASKLKQE